MDNTKIIIKNTRFKAYSDMTCQLERSADALAFDLRPKPNKPSSSVSPDFSQSSSADELHEEGTKDMLDIIFEVALRQAQCSKESTCEDIE